MRVSVTGWKGSVGTGFPLIYLSISSPDRYSRICEIRKEGMKVERKGGFKYASLVYI